MLLPSTKPYLIRAIYEWCCDNGYTPYVAVIVGPSCRVPHEFVRHGQIILNVSAEATNHLMMGNEFIEFQARFGGAARALSIPVGDVAAIYASETGIGMTFEVEETQLHSHPTALTDVSASGNEEGPLPPSPPSPPAPPPPGRPKLQRIK